VNAFLIEKKPTMTMKGGNTDSLYQADGRLRMARSLERVWPHVVRVERRYQRPQHVVHSSWRRFDTQLRLKPGLSLEELDTPNEYGMELRAVRPVKSQALRKLLESSE
jgi:hypothetical protein